MSLGVDPVSPDAMTPPPRPPRERILTRPRLVRILLASAVMAAGTLAVLILAPGPGAAAGTGHRRRHHGVRHVRVLPGVQPAQRPPRHPQRVQPGDPDNRSAFVATAAVIVAARPHRPLHRLSVPEDLASDLEVAIDVAGFFRPVRSMPDSSCSSTPMRRPRTGGSSGPFSGIDKILRVSLSGQFPIYRAVGLDVRGPRGREHGNDPAATGRKARANSTFRRQPGPCGSPQSTPWTPSISRSLSRCWVSPRPRSRSASGRPISRAAKWIPPRSSSSSPWPRACGRSGPGSTSTRCPERRRLDRLVSIGFPINFFGTTFSTFVNNNGNVTFDAPRPLHAVDLRHRTGSSSRPSSPTWTRGTGTAS